MITAIRRNAYGIEQQGYSFFWLPLFLVGVVIAWGINKFAASTVDRHGNSRRCRHLSR